MSQIIGHAHWTIEDAEGNIVASGETRNSVTAVGEKMYLHRGSGASSPPSAPLGMKLGSSSTAPSRTGAGSTLGNYVSNSQQAFASGYPTVSSITGGSRVTYRAVFGPGKATTTGAIREAVIVNNDISNTEPVASEVIARVLISGVPSKGADQTLTVTWMHDLLGG